MINKPNQPELEAKTIQTDQVAHLICLLHSSTDRTEKLINSLEQFKTNNKIFNSIMDIGTDKIEMIRIENTESDSDEYNNLGLGLLVYGNITALMKYTNITKSSDYIVCTNDYYTIDMYRMTKTIYGSNIKIEYIIPPTSDSIRHIAILNEVPTLFEGNIKLICGSITYADINIKKNSMHIDLNNDIILNSMTNFISYRNDTTFLVIQTKFQYLKFLTSINIKIGNIYLTNNIRQKILINNIK
jgi:hypothetical protein